MWDLASNTDCVVQRQTDDNHPHGVQTKELTLGTSEIINLCYCTTVESLLHPALQHTDVSKGQVT